MKSTNASWRSPSDRITGTSLSCFGKPAVLRRILRVSRLTILIGANQRLYYERAKLESRGQGRACLAIGSRLESILKRLPAKGYLFPNLVTVRECVRAWHFCKKRRLAGVEEGVVLHSYRYGWAERACVAGMPEREAMAHLGHGSRAVHRAYARSASRVTLPLEYYEAARDKKLIDFQTAASIQVA